MSARSAVAATWSASMVMRSARGPDQHDHEQQIRDGDEDQGRADLIEPRVAAELAASRM